MMVAVYEIEGIVDLKGRKQSFRVKVEANSEKHALDKLMARFGGTSHIKRWKIYVNSRRSVS